MTAKVVVSDTKVIDLEIEEEILREVDAEIVSTDAREPDALIEAACGADALIIDAGVQVTDGVLEALDLAVVARAGIGYDNVDIRAAADNGVTVVNVPAYGLDEVSTHALSLMLGCARKITTFDRSIKAGEWDWTVGRPMRRLAGSTVGLLAFGKIARSLAAKLRGFDVDVITYDPYVSEPAMAGFDVEKVGFEQLLDRSDFVSIHAPLTDETHGLFDAEAFERMADHAVIVNTGRGGIIDERDLYDAIVDGEIAAAGLDVLETEPPGDAPLLDLDAVIATPHVAFYSEASIADLNEGAAADVVRVLHGENPENPVVPGDKGWH